MPSHSWSLFLTSVPTQLITTFPNLPLQSLSLSPLPAPPQIVTKTDRCPLSQSQGDPSLPTQLVTKSPRFPLLAVRQSVPAKLALLFDAGYFRTALTFLNRTLRTPRELPIYLLIGRAGERRGAPGEVLVWSRGCEVLSAAYTCRVRMRIEEFRALSYEDTVNWSANGLHMEYLPQCSLFCLRVLVKITQIILVKIWHDFFPPLTQQRRRYWYNIVPIPLQI